MILNAGVTRLLASYLYYYLLLSIYLYRSQHTNQTIYLRVVKGRPGYTWWVIIILLCFIVPVSLSRYKAVASDLWYRIIGSVNKSHFMFIGYFYDKIILYSMS